MSDPMQVDSTAVAIALTIPEHCGNFPDVVFSILIKHFSVSWHILSSDEDGMVNPPLFFQTTNDILAPSFGTECTRACWGSNLLLYHLGNKRNAM